MRRLEFELDVDCLRLPCTARETPIGQSIDSYLRNSLDLSDQAIHLLFSANRWEVKYVHTSLILANVPRVARVSANRARVRAGPRLG